jgi:hypothetical protein
MQGENIPASVLGYRINNKFVGAFMGRVFQVLLLSLLALLVQKYKY